MAEAGCRSEGRMSNDIWTQLKDAGLVEGEPPAVSHVATPWYVGTMLGVAGWIGAMFLLGFVATGFAWVVESAVAALFIGGLLCVLAAFIFWRASGGSFADQFAFAVSLAGQALIVVGLSTGLPKQIETVALLLAIVELILFVPIAHFSHRVWTATCGLNAVCIALYGWGLAAYLPALSAALTVAIWSNEFSYPQWGTSLRPFGYGAVLVTISLMFTSGSHSLPGLMGLMHPAVALSDEWLSVWIGAVLVGLVLIGLVMQLLKQEKLVVTAMPGNGVLSGALLVTLISLGAQEIGLATIILLVGFAQRNRVLVGLGIFSLLIYLVYYSYSLQLTLLEKSVWLICGGSLLLVVRFGLRYMTGDEGRQHA